MYILFPQSLCGIAAIDQRHISDKRNNNQPINNLYLRDTTEHHRAPQSTQSTTEHTEHHRAQQYIACNRPISVSKRFTVISSSWVVGRFRESLRSA